MTANYVLLERIELNASAASVTFSNIPQSGYTDLKVVMSARSTYVSTFDFIQVKFNGSTTGYSARALYGTGSSALSASLSVLYAGDIPAVNATSSTFGNHEFYVPNYLGNTNKFVSFDSVAENNATAGYQFLTAGLWSNTAAINSIEMFSGNSQSFVAGSTFSLYGLAAVGTTPAIAPKASGGNIQTDGTYWYHTFLSTGAFVPQTGLSCDYLVVAGGGGAGKPDANLSGGGGAGGLRSTVTATGGGGSLESSISVASGTSYTITVGAGGATATTSQTAGTSGSNSVFSTITSVGGGGGGASTNPQTTESNGKTGGSGGGSGLYLSGSWIVASNGSGTTNQGYAGGGGSTTVGGGGGGAGEAGGTDGTGHGGDGVAISAFATATGTGVSNYYAGGGGGGSGSTGGTGGLGGGGNGGSGDPSTGTSATANTGSGGGGGRGGSGGGGNGGSGIVIIRYPIA